MNKKSNTRNGLIHLYNPKKEGLGSYDVNYINAHKKHIKTKNELLRKSDERFAAWFHLLEVI